MLLPELPLLKNIPDLKGKKVLLRLDLNVPIINGVLIDDFRIRRVLPTLSHLREHGARTIIVSHIENIETDSLEKVADYLKKIIPVTFVKTIDDAKAKVGSLENGNFLLLQNLRLYDGEKQNDDNFAKELAKLGEIYVNEAFSVSHRAHASVVGVPKFLPSYAGFLFQEEVDHLSKAFDPARPFLFILGGAKFETKMPLIEKFLKIADSVFVGGALANDLFQALGFEVGRSVVSSNILGLEGIIANKKLILPSDVTVNSPDQPAKLPSEVLPTDKIMDAGPKTISDLTRLISQSKFVLWNGPLGDYEHGFNGPSIDLAKAIIKSGAHSIVGGGDTLAVLDKEGLLNRFSFVSTAGGAMLQFLADETLPGIEALNRHIA